MSVIQSLRMAMAEWLLVKALDIAPHNAEGARLAEYLSAYATEKLSRAGISKEGVDHE